VSCPDRPLSPLVPGELNDPGLWIDTEDNMRIGNSNSIFLPRCLRERTSGVPPYLDSASLSELALAGAKSKSG